MLSLKNRSLFTVFSFVLTVCAEMDFPPNCILPKSNGVRCAETQPSIQWYFDPVLVKCLAFKYQGCGGNANRFKKTRECESECIPMDFGWCALNSIAEKNKHGETKICGFHSPEPSKKVEPCSKGYRCSSLAFFSICCPTEAEGNSFCSISRLLRIL
ncbi:hypothetical protein AB6A40_006814 [Gnathostoma spinigerum]|uniref:BPTI/Kunitz inhibitor domain-containing protein n=1 Tax=Gnathostoma spinigerum TaxID=75299 RepID=A0ABD6EJG1_9BILA